MQMSCNVFYCDKIRMSVENRVVNVAFHHPFTCIISGPTKSGKTTFIKQLLTAPAKSGLIDTVFSHISIYIGTRIQDNKVFQEMQKHFDPKRFRIVEVCQLYGGDKKVLEENFAYDFIEEMKELGSNGCVVFDDLMHELSSANVLGDLFSKNSSHLGLSVLYTTQNIFNESKKNRTEHRTVYLNSQYLVLFDTPLDSSVFSTLARRLAGGNSKKYRSIVSLMHEVAYKYRYIVVSGNIERERDVMFTSDIFQIDPIPHQRVFMPIS